MSSLLESVPTVKNVMKSYPCWFTYDLIKILKVKIRARIKFLRTKNPIDYALFANLRKEFKARKRLCEETYINDIEDKITTNTKAFFSYTKSLRKTNSIPNRVNFNSEFAEDRDLVCDLFSKYFASVFTHDCHQDFVVNQFAPYLHITDITKTKVKVILDKLDQFKGSSPDNISSIFYKNLSPTISLPLSIIFNKSIQEGYFPSAWKISNVTPVYKAGKRSDVSNYRPISILAAASKVFKRIIFNKVYTLKQIYHTSPAMPAWFRSRQIDSN